MSTEVAIIEVDAGELASMDLARREAAVRDICESTRRWLTSPGARNPFRAAHAKAYLKTLADTASNLSMSREVVLDATGTLRRSERALGVAIREGQERGEIASKGRGAIHVHGVHGTVSRSELITTDPAVMSSPYDYAKHTELYGDGKEGGNGVYAMAEATDEQFEAALAAATEEGNVSRANVVRKIREIAAPDSEAAPKAPSRTLTANSAHVHILDLARRGLDNTTIARQVGLSANAVSDVIMRNPEVRADRERLNILTRTVDALMGGTYALESLTEFSAIDPAQGQEWLDKLQRHMNAVKTVRNSIRKAMES